MAFSVNNLIFSLFARGSEWVMHTYVFTCATPFCCRKLRRTSQQFTVLGTLTERRLLIFYSLFLNYEIKERPPSALRNKNILRTELQWSKWKLSFGQRFSCSFYHHQLWVKVVSFFSLNCELTYMRNYGSS